MADRKVKIYDMFHVPGTYMPRTGFVAMAHDTCVHFNSFEVSAKSRDFNLRAGRVITTETARAANSSDNVEAGYTPP